MVLVALAALGPDGIHRYTDVLSLASQWEPTRRYAVAGPLGLGPQIYVVQAIFEEFANQRVVALGGQPSIWASPEQPEPRAPVEELPALRLAQAGD